MTEQNKAGTLAKILKELDCDEAQLAGTDIIPIPRSMLKKIIEALPSTRPTQTADAVEALLDAAVAFETDADNHTAKANLGPKSERAERTEKANRNAALGKQMRQALARLEQGAA